ncbi:MAG TPA: potassium transporter [Anaeromyxobacter sp.]|nr:potassium transporter [Anaeromyxobacter sp.]
MKGLAATRVFGHTGRGGVKTIGLRRRPLADLYHRLVTGPWTRLLVLYALVYFATQAIFGAVHLLLAAELPAGTRLLPALLAAVESPPAAAAAPLSPRWIASGALAGVEGFIRWLELAIGSGIIFAKFSRIPARVLFSRVAVVAPHQGGRALMFRMANERTSHIADAKVAVMLVRNELSDDGDLVRRAHDLELARGGSALFSHAWTAVHPVTRESPLAGESAESLAASDAELIVTLTGFDEGLTRTIYARHAYTANQIRWNVRFAEIVKLLPNGGRAVDYRRFHDVVSTDPAPAERTPARGRASR